MKASWGKVRIGVTAIFCAAIVSAGVLTLGFTVAVAGSPVPPVPTSATFCGTEVNDLGSGYGSFNEVTNYMYHTGVDLPGTRGSTIVSAAAAGTIVTFASDPDTPRGVLGLTCPQTSTCGATCPEYMVTWDPTTGTIALPFQEFNNAGNPIFGTSRVASTVPCVEHRPAWVWTSVAMVFLP